MKKSVISTGTVATSRKASFHYTFLETLQTGIMLTGGEVKSLRAGHISIGESYVSVENGELFLVNTHIDDYLASKNGFVEQETNRPRKLLLRQKEISHLIKEVSQKGKTIVPLEIFFNERGIAKVKIALAQGKTYADKRETIKKRDWQRDKARIMAHYNSN